MELTIWATVGSQSCFCWLYRVSPSLAAKNIINLISVLTIWWCPCIESSLVLLERVFAMTSVFSWQNSISFCPASFSTPRPNLPATPGISWLPTLAFQYPIMKTASFFVLVKIFKLGKKERLRHIPGDKLIFGALFLVLTFLLESLLWFFKFLYLKF